MPLQYLNYNHGEIYCDDLTPIRYSFSLSQKSIECTIEFDLQETPGKDCIRAIWSGSFAYDNQKLASISVTDLSFALNDIIALSFHFDTPEYRIPYDLNNATKVNYFFSSTGKRYPTDRSKPGRGYDLLKSSQVSSNRADLEGYAWSSRFSADWWKNPFGKSTSCTQSPPDKTTDKADVTPLTGTTKFGAITADRITNFNPNENKRLQIDVSDFGSNAAGTFRVAKNAKELTKALASKTSFIYLKSTGELYYNENGKLPGFGEGGIFAIIENKANVTTKNVEFFVGGANASQFPLFESLLTLF